MRIPDAEMRERKDAIYRIVAESQPTGIRFVYYRAASKGLVPKTDPGYQRVQRDILAMRREGIIPWAWIVDSTRWMRKPITYSSLDAGMQAFAAGYRRRLWDESDTDIEVWCESESVAGVLYPVTSEWDVPLYPVKGQTSESFCYGAAQEIRYSGKNLSIAYFGDHDPHGYEIETNLHSKLVEYSGRRDIEWVRLGCTARDVQALKLSGSVAKKDTYVNKMTGSRTPWTGPAVEVEAIDAPLLRAWLEEWIRLFVDMDNLGMTLASEEQEKNLISTAGLEMGQAS